MPFTPTFTVTPTLLRFVEEISAFREKVLSATVQVPWIPTLQQDARIRNTHSSTAIEGNPLTLAQIRLLEEGEFLPTEPPRATREALNYLAGLRFIEQHLAKKKMDHPYGCSETPCHHQHRSDGPGAGWAVSGYLGASWSSCATTA